MSAICPVRRLICHGVLLHTLLCLLVAPAIGQPAEEKSFVNSLGMAFVRIPAGEFTMGITDDQDRRARGTLAVIDRRMAPIYFNHAAPAHRVRLTQDFFLGKHEVTVGHFAKFVQATAFQTAAEKRITPKGEVRSTWRSPGSKQGPDHPVVWVSWDDAQKFIQWLDDMDKAKPVGWQYRLPTEAEWEYAARGPRCLLFPWGDDWVPKRCNSRQHLDARGFDGFPQTSPVGWYSPNGDSPFGVCDMAGNVEEWCDDFYVFYKDMGESLTDPRETKPRSWTSGVWSDGHYLRQGPGILFTVHVRRGGSWDTWPDYCLAGRRCLQRHSNYQGLDSGHELKDLGFRVALVRATRGERPQPPR